MKLLFKTLPVVFGAALVVAAYLTFSHQPEPFAEGSESALRLAAGPYVVERLEQQFVDAKRPTPPNRDYPGEPQRVLPGDVWYPGGAAAGASPLLIFSHGFTSLRDNGEYLARHLASYGFVVVAVDYPLTSWGAPGGANVEDVVNQPGDISFLIDTVVGYSTVSGHALSGRVDSARIGVAGISLGGLTSTLAGFHPRLSDPRIGAVLSMAGPSNFFTARFFEHRKLPFMMLAGDLDVLVPFAVHAAPMLDKLPDSELVMIRGGSHTGFSGGTALLRAMRNTDALACWSVMRSIDDDQLNAPPEILGSRDIGIDYDAVNELCEVDPLPKTINVLRQQMIARVVVTAFFEEHFAEDAERRKAAVRYLSDLMVKEIPELVYTRSAAISP